VVKYLQMDGVDDYLKTPTITFKKIEINMLWENVSQTDFILRLVNDTNILIYNGTFGNGLGQAGGYRANTFVNNTEITNSNQIPYNERLNLSLILHSVTTDIINIFADELGGRTAQGNIYDIKFYNDTTLVAHYDMSTGTVQDQSGNGNHATLVGGTWVDDGTGGGTTEPIDAGDITLSASSTFTAQANRILTADSDLQANSNLSVFANRILNADSLLSATTSLTAEGEVISLELSVNMSASTSLTAQGTRLLNGDSNLSAESFLTAEGEVLTLELFVNMSASSNLTVDASRILNADAVLSAHGEVLASGTAIYNGEAVFIATGTIDPIVLDYSNYRQVIPFDLVINLRDFADLNIALKQKFNLDI
jgi:hypothetical protein